MPFWTKVYKNILIPKTFGFLDHARPSSQTCVKEKSLAIDNVTKKERLSTRLNTNEGNTRINRLPRDWPRWEG